MTDPNTIQPWEPANWRLIARVEPKKQGAWSRVGVIQIRDLTYRAGSTAYGWLRLCK